MVWYISEVKILKTDVIYELVVIKGSNYISKWLIKIVMRRPGIEPGAQEWESCMLPLHQRREATSFGKLKYYKRKSYIYVVAAPKSKLRTAVHSALKCAISGCFCYG